MRLDSSVFLCHTGGVHPVVRIDNLLHKHSVKERETPEEPAAGRAGVLVAISIDAALAALVLVGRGASVHGGIGSEQLGGLAIAAAYASPAIVGMVALRGRPALLVAAGFLAGALSFTAFSMVTLVLVPAAVLLLGAAWGLGERGRRIALGGAVLSLPLVVAAMAAGFFAAVWALPLLFAGWGLGLLARHGVAAHSWRRATRTVGGVLLVVGLAAAAWATPILNATTVCWTSRNGAVTATTVPGTGANGGSVTVGPLGQGESAGCDSGVPDPAASLLSLALLGGCVAASIVVIPAAGESTDGNARAANDVLAGGGTVSSG